MPTIDTRPIHYIEGVAYREGTPEYEQALADYEGRIADEMATEQALWESTHTFDAQEVLTALITMASPIISVLPDEAIGRMQPYFKRWETGVGYITGDLRTYGDGVGYVYRCLQPHTSQVGYEPDVAVSLWAKVLTSATDILPWEQPSSTNPYMKGDKVLWDGHTWESAIDYNVYMPGGVGTGGLWIMIA